jgi:AraC-like DNA-binding protein/ligand-binding sensor protein
MVSKKLFRTLLPKTEQNILENILLDVEQEFKVWITVHDLAAIFRDSLGNALFDERRYIHRHSYCNMGRVQISKWDQNCLNHCRNNVNAEARRIQEPFVHNCWKGVQEIVIPMMKDGIHLATFFAGAYRSSLQASALPRKILQEWKQLPLATEDEWISLARILRAIVQGLFKDLEKIHQLQHHQEDRTSQVRRFIFYRSQQDITLHDLAKDLCLSPSRTSHVVRELFDVSFQDLVLNERLNRAKFFLQSSNLKSSEIAERVGIPNEYYFSRIFKKRLKISPSDFRRKFR